MPTFEESLAAKAPVARRLLSPEVEFCKSLPASLRWLIRNVTGVGAGRRIRHGIPARGDFCLRVYVGGRVPGAFGRMRELVRDLIGDFPIDIIETGRFRPHLGGEPAADPLRLGAEIRLAGVNSSGTLGAFVHRDGKIHLLSCGHVLDGRGNLGQPVLSNGEIVGFLSAQNLLDPEGRSSHDGEDCACAILARGASPCFELPEPIGRLSSATPITGQPGMEVMKVGRDIRAGVIIDTHVDLRVHYGSLVTILRNQLLVRGNKFSRPGDSGALVVSTCGAEHSAVGLVIGSARPPTIFASDPAQDCTCVAPMDRVLSAMNAELALG